MKHLVFALAAMLVGGGLVLGCSSDDDPACIGTDRNYAIGEVFDDDCRQCTCNDDTTITCVATDACDAGCEDDDGNSHAVGSFWPAGDGCNICQCVDAGDVSCTENACGTP